MRLASTSFAVLMSMCLLGCTENQVIREPNSMPRADAGSDQVVPYAGVPVDVWLDGTRSVDDDGTIIAYRWLSATRPPGGGSGRYVPPGESPDWPADFAQTMVRLPEGTWRFSLQVTDDDQSSSAQDVVTITVGAAPVGGAGPGGTGGMAAPAAGSGGTGGVGGAGGFGGAAGTGGAAGAAGMGGGGGAAGGP